MTTTVEKTTTTTDSGVSSKKKSRKFSPWGVVAWLVGLGFFFPVFWMVLTAFKQEGDAATSPPKLFFTPTLDQFAAVFDKGIGPAMLNSVFATGVSTLLVLLLGTPAAFALSLRPVRKTQDALFFFMSTKMLPIVAAILPLYVIVSNIGLLDNIWALVILYTSMNLPIAVWMMRSFFLEVPGELLEAASLDGASLWRAVREVILPLVSPGIAATIGSIFVLMKKNNASWVLRTGRSDNANAAGVPSASTSSVETPVAQTEFSIAGPMP
jgi:sorbitol/mannitol transport system permease protein